MKLQNSLLKNTSLRACACRYQNGSVDPYQAVLDLHGYQGPVVQSVVSLTSLLRVISLTVLVDSIYNILIFFAEKM